MKSRHIPVHSAKRYVQTMLHQQLYPYIRENFLEKKLEQI